jgi:hypothetical protein
MGTLLFFPCHVSNSLGPTGLRSKCHFWFFPLWLRVRSVDLTTHPHLVYRPRPTGPESWWSPETFCTWGWRREKPSIPTGILTLGIQRIALLTAQIWLRCRGLSHVLCSCAPPEYFSAPDHQCIGCPLNRSAREVSSEHGASGEDQICSYLSAYRKFWIEPRPNN